MLIEIATAWLLHRRSRGENSAYLTLFTADYGLISALCHGCNRKQVQSAVQQFTPLWLSVQDKSERLYVSKIEAQGAALNFSKDNLFACLYVNELLYKTLKPFDTYLNLFNYYNFFIHQMTELSDKISIATALRRFESKLLSELGYAVDYRLDATDNQDINADLLYRYVADVGFMRSKSGIRGADIISLSKDDYSLRATLQAAKLINRLALDNILAGKVIHTRELYKTNFAINES